AGQLGYGADRLRMMITDSFQKLKPLRSQHLGHFPHIGEIEPFPLGAYSLACFDLADHLHGFGKNCPRRMNTNLDALYFHEVPFIMIPRIRSCSATSRLTFTVTRAECIDYLLADNF